MSAIWFDEDEDIELYEDEGEDEEFYEDELNEDEWNEDDDTDECLSTCPSCGGHMDEMWCENCGASFVIDSEMIGAQA